MTATALLAALTLTVFVPNSDSPCGLARADRARTLSTSCLACHDGSAAPSIRMHVAGAQGSHPVGVAYAAARRQVAVRLGGPLDPRLLLPLGRVECVTCHAIEGSGPRWTVVSFGALCTSCHDK